MKNLKFGLLSLLAILAVSVFLTSCEQEEVITQTTEELTLTEDIIYTLPKECNTMSEDELIEYLENLTPSEWSNLASTGTDIEDRSCGSWRYIGSSWCDQDINYPSCENRRQKSKLKLQARWCGSPNNGVEQTRKRHVGCCY